MELLDLPSDRREFLTGRAALRSLAGLLEPRPASSSCPPRRFGPEASSYLLVFSRQAMACDFQVLVNAGQYPGAEEAATRALDLVARLERQLTVFDDQSELSQINRQAYDAPVPVEAQLFELLEYSRRLSLATGGAFDVTAAPLWRLWGFARRAARVPSAEELAEAMTRVGSKLWECDQTCRTVRFLRPGMEIHLGAIGKGYALDRAAHELLLAGVEDFLLHGGHSSVLARGSRSGQTCWTVGIAHPLVPQRRIGRLRLRNAAIGTTSAAHQYFYYQGKRYGHVLDPRTGLPAEGLLAVTVRAPLAATADALATAFYVMGADAARAFCAEYPEVGAVLVRPGPRAGEVQTETVGLSDDEFVLETDDTPPEESGC